MKLGSILFCPGTTTRLLDKVEFKNVLLYSKNPYIRTLNFEGKAAVGSYLMITNSNVRLLGS